MCDPLIRAQALHDFINTHAIKPVLAIFGPYANEKPKADDVNSNGIAFQPVSPTAEQLFNVVESTIREKGFVGNTLVLDTFCVSWEPSIIPYHITFHYCFYDLNIVRPWVVCIDEVENPVSSHTLAAIKENNPNVI